MYNGSIRYYLPWVYPGINVFIDVENPWFLYGNNLHLVGFPHLCLFTGGHIHQYPITIPLLFLWNHTKPHYPRFKCHPIIITWLSKLWSSLIKQLKIPNNTHISTQGTHHIQVLRNGLLCGSRRFCLGEPLHRAGRGAQCLGGWAKTSRTGDFLHVFWWFSVMKWDFLMKIGGI